VLDPVHLSPVLVLAELFHMAPPALFPPASMKDIVNSNHIGQETGLKRPFTIGSQGLQQAGSGSGQSAILGPNGKACRQSINKGSLVGQKEGGLWSHCQYQRC
jgi:hypothetical protein